MFFYNLLQGGMLSQNICFLFKANIQRLYLRVLETVPEVREALIWHFDLHNNRKPHQALNHKTPIKVFENGRAGLLLK